MLWLYVRMFPELRRFDRTERREAWRRARLAGMSHALLTAGFLLLLLLIPTANHLLDGLKLEARLVILLQLAGLLLVAGLMVVLYWLFSRPIRRSLRRQLVERGTPVCVGCGYDLAGCSSPRCPECGVALSPRQRATRTASSDPAP